MVTRPVDVLALHHEDRIRALDVSALNTRTRDLDALQLGNILILGECYARCAETGDHASRECIMHSAVQWITVVFH